MKWVVMIVAAVLVSIWQALVGSVMWNWFIAPLGLPIINLWHAWGVSLTISAFRAPHYDSEQEYVTSLIVATVGSAFALAFGFILQGIGI